ncbi:biotin/lipoyl-containing protein, partial [Streptomyces sp. NPDC000410]|uniref:biotin/lipoyl-containing protein n=1 Tax=Streptomyces sp. NPDC000410 TaxID=3154254 RepID=UPI00332E1E65
MPDVGEGLTDAEILRWYVRPGDTVTDGQVVCEVETAKAAVELPIPYDGVVHELCYGEGATVDVGAPIITVSVPSEPDDAPRPSGGGDPGWGARSLAGGDAGRVPAPAAEGGSGGVAEAATGRQPVLVGYGVAESPTKRRPRRRAEGAVTAPPPTHGPGAEPATRTAAGEGAGVAPPAATRPSAKPPVRKLAKDLGVDLATVVPSGPDGIITRE